MGNLSSANEDLVLDVGGLNDLVMKRNGVEVGRTGSGGFGKVLQVVSSVVDTDAVGSTNVFHDVVSASITPTAITSKILIMVSASVSVNGANEGYLRLLRDATPIGLGSGVGDVLGSSFFGNSSNWEGVTTPITYMDSPLSTSPITYKAQAYASANELLINRRGTSTGGDSGQAISTITLMEIGA